ncbi:restriction endonuclease subunit S [Pseudomonadales bacterium]|nr:restriction endonuclease subunit S [Pseudomonadales bacterium]
MGSELRDLWSNAGGIAPNDWKFSTLEDLLLTPKSISVGVMYPGKHVLGGIPLIKVSNVANGTVVKTPVFCISEKVDEEYKRTRLKGKELLLTLVGNPGDCVIVTPEMAGWNAARALAVLTLKDESLRYWLRMVLLSDPSKHIIDSRLNTTVQRTLNLKDVRDIPIPLPPKSVRDYLCDIAKTIEEKIELNRKTNETLEQMAQALFKSWFVDLDPVIDNALEAGNTIPDELQDRAERRQHQLAKPDHQPLPSDIRQLFPSEFELTEELGWVPMGWEINNAEAVVVRLKAGKRYAKKDVSSNGRTPVYEQGQSIILGYNDDEASFSASIEEPTFIFGDHTCVTKLGVEPFSISANVIPLKGGMRNTYWTYFAVKDLQSFEEYRRHWMEFSIKPVITPSVETADLFENMIRPYIKKINDLERNSNNLEKTRDTLLPKLISGELRLPSDTEQQPAAANS